MGLAAAEVPAAKVPHLGQSEPKRITDPGISVLAAALSSVLVEAAADSIVPVVAVERREFEKPELWETEPGHTQAESMGAVRIEVEHTEAGCIGVDPAEAGLGLVEAD